MCRGLGYVTPSTQFESATEEALPSHFSDLSEWELDVSVGVAFKDLFTNMRSISHLEPDENVDRFSVDP